MGQGPTSTGLDAWRAWRQLPKAKRKELMKRTPSTSEEASVALDYSRFALSSLGIALFVGPALLIFVGVAIAMALFDIGPDTFDILLFSAMSVFIAFNHVNSSRQLRSRVRYALSRNEWR